MIPDEKFCKMEKMFSGLESPVLIISTRVGKGMYSIGEAICEHLKDSGLSDNDFVHSVIEDCVSDAILREDVTRYRFIVTRIPWLLYLIYKTPFVYMRKYIREILFENSGLGKLSELIAEVHPRVIFCVSHRSAFWVSNFKRKNGGNFKIWGLLGEYGKNYGWKYVFWKQIDAFFSPVSRLEVGFKIAPHVSFRQIELPCKKEFTELAKYAGKINEVLVAGGYWGHANVFNVIFGLKQLADWRNKLIIHVVAGDNENVLKMLRTRFSEKENVFIYSALPSLANLMKRCGVVVTKPGISSILEAHAAGRKIFLMKGLPVAEDHNARYAIRNFGAEWYSETAFLRWLYSREALSR